MLGRMNRQSEHASDRRRCTYEYNICYNLYPNVSRCLASSEGVLVNLMPIHKVVLRSALSHL